MFCSARCLVHAVRTHHLHEARLEPGRLFPGQEAATLLPNQYLLALRLGLAGGGAGGRGSQQYGAGGLALAGGGYCSHTMKIFIIMSLGQTWSPRRASAAW